MTEMSRSAALAYINKLATDSKYFLSINHEQNDFTVNDLVKESKFCNLVSRQRAWICPGYFEQLYSVNVDLVKL